MNQPLLAVMRQHRNEGSKRKTIRKGIKAALLGRRSVIPKLRRRNLTLASCAASAGLAATRQRRKLGGLRGERVKTVWMTVLRKRVTKIRSRRAEPVEVNGTTIFSEVSEPERLIIVQAKGSQQSKEY